MKLHRIALRNLNSLYGHSVIDLEEGLGEAPLFLIMGPTGAGKSTILDAVALALFGETPRLDRGIASAEENLGAADSRNIMSMGTGSCRAELVFSKVAPGGGRVRYRAIWTCQRARGAPDGRFQAPERSLERFIDGSWTMLVSGRKKADLRAVFDEALEGMTVEDFKRSMLLAQGDFAAFLRAEEDERAAILERLTNTSQYKTIGQRANQLKRRIEEQIKLAEAALTGFALLEPEALAQRRGQLKQLDGAASELREELLSLELSRRWLAREGALSRALEQAGEASVEAEREVPALERDRRRLAEDARCRPLRSELARVRQLRRERSELRGQLADLAEDLEELAGQRGLRLEAERGRAAQAAELEREQAALAPLLEQLGALDTRLRQAREEAEQARRAQAEAAQLDRAAREKLSTAQEEQRRYASQLLTLEARLEAARAWSGLRDTMGALQERAARWREGARRVARERATLVSARAALEEERAALGAQKEARTPARVALEEAVARRRAAEAALRALLEGREPAAGRALLAARGEELAQRRRDLDAAHRAEADCDSVGAELSELLGQIERARAASVDAAQRADESGAAAQEVRARLAERQQHLATLRWVLELVRHRPELEQGEPCPLCGSESHPFGIHPPAPEQARADRAAALEASIEGDAAELARRASEAEQAREQMLVLEERLAGLSQRSEAVSLRQRAVLDARDALWARLALSREETLFAPPRAQVLARAEAAWRAGRALLAEQRRALEEGSQQLSGLWSQEREAERQVASEEAAWSRAEAALEQRASELERAGARLAEREAEQATLRQGVLGPLVESGFAQDEVDDAGLQAALEGAARRLATLATWRRERDALEVRLAGLRERLTQLTERAGHAATRHTELETAVAQREAAVAALGAERALLDGVPSLAVRQAGLERRRAELEEAAETARDAIRAMGEKGAQLEGRRAVGAQRLERLGATLEQAAAELDRQLDALGLAADEVELRLLPESERSALAERVAERERALALSRDRLRSVRQELAAHRARRPSHLEAATDLEELDVRIEDLRAELEQINERLGDVRGELRRQEDQRARHAQALARRNQLHQRARVWRRLQRLIGVRDGDVFKRYAQVLNLGELVAKANAHLVRLSDRYRLTPSVDRKTGEQVLGFSIMDRYQASSVRPLTTLSGGETFLVSLALALALADYRSVNLPIETLLLDEGFGTLDGRSLDLAMNALERLRASGTQVGLISHVAALQERVPARIVVEPLGNGRSRLRTELSG